MKQLKPEKMVVPDDGLFKFPENIYEYMKYLSNYLGKTSDSWGKTTQLFQELETSFKRTAQILMRVSDSMVELYNQNQKLHLMLADKDEEVMRFFNLIRQEFLDWGEIIRSSDRGPSRSNSKVHPYFHRK